MTTGPYWQCVNCKGGFQVPKPWVAPGGALRCVGCLSQEIADLKKKDAEEIGRAELVRRETVGDSGDTVNDLLAFNGLFGDGWAPIKYDPAAGHLRSAPGAAGRYQAVVGTQERLEQDAPQLKISMHHCRLAVCVPSGGLLTSTSRKAEGLAYLTCGQGSGCLAVMHSTTPGGLQELIRSHEAAAKKKSTRAWALERNYPVEKHATALAEWMAASKDGKACPCRKQRPTTQFRQRRANGKMGCGEYASIYFPAKECPNCIWTRTAAKLKTIEARNARVKNLLAWLPAGSRLRQLTACKTLGAQCVVLSHWGTFWHIADAAQLREMVALYP